MEEYDGMNESSLNSSYFNYDTFIGKEIDLPSTKSWFHRSFDPIRLGSVRGAIAAIFALTMSPCCILFPSIVHRIGLYPTIGIVLFIGTSNMLSLFIIKSSALKTTKCDYILFISTKLGSKGETMYICLSLLTMLGLLIGHISICYDLFVNVANELQYKIIITILCCVIHISLCMIRSIILKYYLSIGGLIALLYSIGIIIYQLVKEVQYNYIPPMNTPSFNIFNIIFSYGIINSCFFNQSGMHGMIRSIANPNSRRANKLIISSFIFTTLLYLTAFSGYYSSSLCLERLSLLFNCNISNDFLVFSGKIAFVIAFHMFLPIKWSVIDETLKAIKPDHHWYNTFRFPLMIVIIIIVNVIGFFRVYKSFFSFFGGISLILSMVIPLIMNIKVLQKQNGLMVVFKGVTVIAMILGLGSSILTIVSIFKYRILIN